MALTRKFLAAMGIEEDKIDEIISAHSETVTGLKGEIDKFKAEAEKATTLEKELADAKKSLDAGDKSPYKVKYEAAIEEKEALQKQFDDYKADIEAKKTLRSKQDAYRAILKDAGVSEKRIDSIMKISDEQIAKIEFDEAGATKDAEAIKKAISEEWADFIQTTDKKGAQTATPPSGTGSEKDLGTLNMADYIAARKKGQV